MTGSNPFSATYHERMPCVLDDASFKAWLDPERYDAKKFLVPYPHDDLVAEQQTVPQKEGEPEHDLQLPLAMQDELF
jgi:putative SOS response-associated peptidase YedK